MGSDAGVLTRVRWFRFRKVHVTAVAHVWVNQNQPESEFRLIADKEIALLVSLPEFLVCLLAGAELPSWSKATLILLPLEKGLLRGHARVKRVLCRC